MSAITTHRIRIAVQTQTSVNSTWIIPSGEGWPEFLIPNSSFLILPGSSFLIQAQPCA